MLALVFSSLGRRVARHPRLTVVVWVVLTGLGFALALFGVHGESVFDRVTTGAPSIPGSDSERATEILAENDEGGPEITLLVSDVDPADAQVVEAMTEVNADLVAIEGVDTVINGTRAGLNLHSWDTVTEAGTTYLTAPNDRGETVRFLWTGSEWQLQ